MWRFALALQLAWLGSALAHPVRAQHSGHPLADISKLCAAEAEASGGIVSLPATSKALREHKKITALAVGATPLSARDQQQGHYALVEKVLEGTVKGLQVMIVDRGVSGELARDSARRIQNEVALVQPQLVFWQVGVADALSLTPANELKATLSETVKWLKEHDVDVVLIGLKYQRSLSKNAGYQKIRQAIREVVREQAILRVGHYESVEALDKLNRQPGEPASESDLTDAGATCMADYLSRALAVGLFAKPKRAPTPVTAPGGPPAAVPAATVPPPNGLGPKDK